MRGVMEGPQHSCNILKRRFLFAPLFNRARRFALKINDYKIGTGIENLTQMIIAMNSCPAGFGGACERRMQFVQDLPFTGQYLLRESVGIFRQRAELSVKELKA